MRHSALLLGLLLLVWGCASTGPDPSTENLPSCEQILAFSQSGDHKPAADAMGIRDDLGVVCPIEVNQAVAASRETLRAADEFASAGLAHRRDGNTAAARASFEEARRLYPKYHWIGTLLAGLEEGDSEQVRVLRLQAADLRSEGRIEEALAVLEQAATLAPNEPTTAGAVSELRTVLAFRNLAQAKQEAAEDRLAEAANWVTRAIEARPDPETARLRVLENARSLGLSLFSAGELLLARQLWTAALTLNESDATLLEYLGEVDARLESLSSIQSATDR